MKLLIVDDNELNREMAEDIIREMGVECVSVDSGKACLDIAEKIAFDAVLMDYMMPEMDGAKATLALHEMPGCENIPVIAMTAEEDPVIIKSLLEAGISSVLHKPVEPLDVYKTLNEYTEGELVKPKAPSSLDICNDVVLKALDELDFDVNSGIRFTGSLKHYKQYALDFTRLFPGILEELDRCMSEGDNDNFTINIHGLKSNFRALGNTGLFKKCRKMENLGKEGKFEEQKQEYLAALPVFKSAMEDLYGVFGRRKLLPQFTGKELISALRELRDAMVTFDLDTGDSILSDLENHEIRPEMQADIGQLHREVSGLKYEGAIKSIDMILSKLKEGQYGI